YGPDDQRVDARVAKGADLGLRAVARSDDRDEVDELVGEREHCLGLLAGEIQVLHLFGLTLESVARNQAVVEVLLPRAHATDVQRKDRPSCCARFQYLR